MQYDRGWNSEDAAHFPDNISDDLPDDFEHLDRIARVIFTWVEKSFPASIIDAGTSLPSHFFPTKASWR
jgi:hypothetical protein